MGHDDALVILEPDALPQLGQCEQGDRLSMLSYAVDALSTTGARVYIDAGHENWLSAEQIADRLKMVGVDKVTGFSLNVSNFYTTEDEVRFAESVRSELSKLGIADSHYVIDISRNGAGPQTEICNPSEARLGRAPQLFRGGALDGLLWIKPPGETDGACRDAPTVGFWAPAALSLLGLEGNRRRAIGVMQDGSRCHWSRPVALQRPGYCAGPVSGGGGWGVRAVRCSGCGRTGRRLRDRRSAAPHHRRADRVSTGKLVQHVNKLCTKPSSTFHLPSATPPSPLESRVGPTMATPSTTSALQRNSQDKHPPHKYQPALARQPWADHRAGRVIPELAPAEMA